WPPAGCPRRWTRRSTTTRCSPPSSATRSAAAAASASSSSRRRATCAPASRWRRATCAPPWKDCADVNNRVAVLHGVNLNTLGRRPAEHYGTLTLPELERAVGRFAHELSLE